MTKLTLTNEDLAAAAAGLELERDRIQTRINEIRQMLDGRVAAIAPATETQRPRKKRSAAARRKMALAQRARWAKIRQESKPAQPEPKPAKRKRKLSAAGRAAIIEATKRRWAMVKAAAKKATSAKSQPKRVKKTTARRSKATAAAPVSVAETAAQ